MFSSQEREHLTQALLNAAKTDPRISGGAITGSKSVGMEDAWSDIDLAFGVRGDLQEPLDDFTQTMYEHHQAVHHTDVHSGAWIYRVFLLESTLQVDVAFAPEGVFGARAPTFKLVFGQAKEIPQSPKPEAESLIGLAWLYALHVRSSIKRGKLWQAEYMVSGMRDQVLALACLRHDLPTREGRGLDQLPTEATAKLQSSLVRELTVQELARAFREITEAFIAELNLTDKPLSARLSPVLEAMNR